MRLTQAVMVKNGQRGRYLDTRAEIPGRKGSDAPSLTVGVRAFGDAVDALAGKPQDTHVTFEGRVEVEVWDGKTALRVIVLKVLAVAEPPTPLRSSVLGELSKRHNLNPDKPPKHS